MYFSLDDEIIFFLRRCWHSHTHIHAGGVNSGNIFNNISARIQHPERPRPLKYVACMLELTA